MNGLAECLSPGCKCGDEFHRRILADVERRRWYRGGMRALASLMYWARLERQCRLIPAHRGWRYVSREVFTTLRVDALGQAIIDSCLPPGLEWTR